MEFTSNGFIEDPFHSLEDLEQFNGGFQNFNQFSNSSSLTGFGGSDIVYEFSAGVSPQWFEKPPTNCWSNELQTNQWTAQHLSNLCNPQTSCKGSELQNNEAQYDSLYINCRNFANPTCSEQFSPLPCNPSSYDPNSRYNCDSAQFSLDSAVSSPTKQQQVTDSQFSRSETLSPQVQTKFVSEKKFMNTKEELMALLETLEPSEVDQLRTAKQKRVATSLVSEDRSRKSRNNYHSFKSVTRHIASTLSNEPHSPIESSATLNDSDIEFDNTVVTLPGSLKNDLASKLKRRTPHNLIEKKYRYSINDGIQKLKSLVATPEEKLSKSGILRSAINYITALQEENYELQKEVVKLRRVLKDAGIEVPKPSALLLETQMMHPISPKCFYSSSDSASLESSPPSQVGASHPMVDKARLTIFVFMFMFVICNPLSIFMKRFPANMNTSVIEDVIPGRTLQEYSKKSSFETLDSEGIWWQSPIVPPCLIWSVNIFVIICFLTRLLVFGEPVADAESSSWAHFLKMRADAHACIRSCNYTEAKKNLQECLRVLERPLPNAKYDELFSVMWQIIRHLLNSIWIGRCFSRIRRSAVKTVRVVCRSHAQTAIVYHQLNQLHVTGLTGEGGKLAGLNFALCSVNLAESAGCSSDGLSHALRADIYINAALQMKLTLPPFLGAILSVYFMRRAKRHIRRAEEGVRKKFMWLYHPLARRFISNKDFVLEHLHMKANTFLPYVRSCSFAKPVERLISAFKMEIFKQFVGELNAASGIGTPYFCEVSKLLFTICAAPNMPSGILNIIDSTSFDGEGDEICAWWTHVFICALYWKDGKYGIAAEHYAAVRRCPKTLLAEPISLALGHALCARKICIHDRSNVHFSRFVWLHSSWTLSGLRNLTAPAPAERTSSIADVIGEKMCLLALEWLLMSFFDLWYSHLDSAKPYWEQMPSTVVRRTYEEILMKYRSLAKKDVNCSRKVAVFELASRVLNGSSPVNIRDKQLIATSLEQTDPSLFFYISESDNSHNYLIEVLKNVHSQSTVVNFRNPSL